MTVSESLSRVKSQWFRHLWHRGWGDLRGTPTPGRGQINAKSEKTPSFGSPKFQASNLGIKVFYDLVCSGMICRNWPAKMPEKINIVPKKKPNFNIIQLWKLKAMVSQSPLSLPTNMQTGKANAVMGAGSKAPGVAPIITGSATK